MKRLLVVVLLLSGCATGPSPEEIEYRAYVNVLNEQIRNGQVTRAQGEYLAAQKVNELRERRAGRRSAEAASAANNAAVMQQGINMMNQQPCRNVGGRIVC